MNQLKLVVITILISLLSTFCFAEESEKVLVIKLVQKQVEQPQFKVTSDENLSELEIQKTMIFLEKHKNMEHSQSNLRAVTQMTSRDINSIQENAEAKISMTNMLNEYTGEIQVGKNQDKFVVLIDTKSSNFWLNSKDSVGCYSRSSEYNCQENTCSSTISEIYYENVDPHTVYGQMTSELVTIGTISTDYPLLAATKCDGIQYFIKYDGVLGLGVKKEESIVNKLYSEKKIAKNVFAFKFSSYDLSQVSFTKDSIPLDNDTQLILGGYDQSIFYEQDLRYYKAISSDHWAIQLSSHSYRNIEYFSPTQTTAIFDSLRPFIYMPKEIYQQFNETIYKEFDQCWSHQQLVCQCPLSRISQQPPLVFIINDITDKDQIVKILPEYYILPYLGQYCYFQVAPSPSPHEDKWIFGTTFMRQMYTIFDFNNMVIRMANLGYSEYAANNNNNNTTTNCKTEQNGGYSFFLLIGLILTILGILYYIKKQQKKRLNEQLELSQQQDDTQANHNLQELKKCHSQEEQLQQPTMIPLNDQSELKEKLV